MKFIVTKDYLNSPAYEKEMQLPYGNRHSKDARDRLGVWRWAGMYQHKDKLIPLIFNNDRGVDLGGAVGLLKRIAWTVDLEKKDMIGRDVDFHKLEDIDFKPSFIFSSHTLEHFYELDKTVKTMYDLLEDGGHLILNLPSWQQKRWRAGSNIDMGGTFHQFTFCLSNTVVEEGLDHLVEIDKVIAKYFKIELAEYVNDNCILIIAKK